MEHRILVVEDDAHFMGILRDYLSWSGFQVREAEDGLAGLDAFDQEQPDIVLSDVLLPFLDGFELATRIKADPRGVDIPIVLMSAVRRDAASIRLDLRDCGAADYLAKPFSMVDLRATLLRCLRGDGAPGSR
jgi:DNA-binding response OmpR family regulator